MRILDGYILREMLAPLAFGVIAFTSIFVGTDLVRLVQVVTEFGAPLGLVGQLFILQLPQIVVWTLPMSVLLATLLSLSRLSASSELVAMQTAGISFYRLVSPVVAVGLGAALLAVGVGEQVVPAANAAYNRIMVEEVRGGRLPTVTRNVILKEYSGGVLEGFLYAREFDSKVNVMRAVTMVTLRNAQPYETTFAEQVVWDGASWYMENGVSHRHEDGETVVSMTFRDSRQPVTIGYRPRDVAQAQRSPEEMTFAELRDHVRILREQGAEARREIVELHLKLAIPAASLVFVLVGAPLGVQSHRTATAIGFGLSMVVILIYYILMTIGTALGQGGHMPPAVGAWLQNILVGAGGIALMVRKGRR